MSFQNSTTSVHGPSTFAPTTTMTNATHDCNEIAGGGFVGKRDVTSIQSLLNPMDRVSSIDIRFADWVSNLAPAHQHSYPTYHSAFSDSFESGSDSGSSRSNRPSSLFSASDSSSPSPCTSPELGNGSQRRASSVPAAETNKISIEDCQTLGFTGASFLVEKMYGPSMERHTVLLSTLTTMITSIFERTLFGSQEAFLALFYVNRVFSANAVPVIEAFKNSQLKLDGQVQVRLRSLVPVQMAMLLVRLYILCLILAAEWADDYDISWFVESWCRLMHIDFHLYKKSSLQLQFVLDHNVHIGSTEWFSWLDHLSNRFSDVPIVEGCFPDGAKPTPFRDLVNRVIGRSASHLSKFSLPIPKSAPESNLNSDNLKKTTPRLDQLERLLLFLTCALPDAMTDPRAFVSKASPNKNQSQSQNQSNGGWYGVYAVTYGDRRYDAGVVDGGSVIELGETEGEEDVEASPPRQLPPRSRFGTPAPAAFLRRTFTVDEEEEDGEEVQSRGGDEEDMEMDEFDDHDDEDEDGDYMQTDSDDSECEDDDDLDAVYDNDDDMQMEIEELEAEASMYPDGSEQIPRDHGTPQPELSAISQQTQQHPLAHLLVDPFSNSASSPSSSFDYDFAGSFQFPAQMFAGSGRLDLDFDYRCRNGGFGYTNAGAMDLPALSMGDSEGLPLDMLICMSPSP
ncbi:hypothetical protein VKT23_012182 [Stygiomarasmius scandens]|uniref:Uncharacterized protein n=1 Tax=Marasmiellus scandens TaxID=2682957 RepID=A0ABR1JC54_9AGAR